MLQLSLLSSGSRANSIFIASESTRILVDCGLSAKETEKRLQSIGSGLDEIDAIIISHEHSDHVRGLPNILKRRSVPVWMNEGTRFGTGESIPPPLRCHLEEFTSAGSFEIGDLKVEPFRVSHDAEDPVMFRVASANSAIAVVTDLGHVTTTVLASVREVDAIVLETNHDVDLLFGGPYPWYLKQRIRGQKGHLSNEEAGELLVDLANYQHSLPIPRRLQLVVGAHVSERNNTPSHSLAALQAAWEKLQTDYQPEFFVADAFQATKRFSIHREHSLANFFLPLQANA